MKTCASKLLGLLTVLCLSASLRTIQATSTMRLSADNGASWLTVTDNGPLDSNPTAGFIVFSGPLGDWVLVTSAGIGRPATGSPAKPVMDVNMTSYSSGPAVLIIQMSDTGFTLSSGNQTYNASIIGSTDGQVRFRTWRDTGNVLFGTSASYLGDPAGISPSATAVALTAQGPFAGANFLDATSVAVVPHGNGLYSLTMETVVTHLTAGLTRTDALLYSPLSMQCPNDLDLGCNPAAIPECNPSQVFVDSDDPASVVVTCSTANMTNGCNRARMLTYTATDSSGATATCTQRILWRVDTNAPVFGSLANKTPVCDQPWNFDVPTASDNCDQPLVTIESTVTNSTECGYTATRVWRATDVCGNFSFATQTVTIACGGNACVPASFKFSKDSGDVHDGPDGNIRTFTSGGISLKATAFSRAKTSGTWSTAYLGLYTGGFGVTDSSEGDGDDDNQHTTDNEGRDNFILIEFSQPIILDKISLGTVYDDSDLRLWIGTFPDPFNNHLTLSDAVLGSFGFVEDNTGGSSARTANVNAGNIVGNAIVIAARPGETTDKFKVQILELCIPGCVPTQTSTPPPATPSGALPSGWSTKDLGSVAATGAAASSAGTLTVAGSGADIWGTSDEFRYVYVPSSGDCSIVARVVSVQNTHSNAKAGLLFRETLSSGAQTACVFLTPGSGAGFQYRSATGGSTTLKATANSLAAPYWLKLVRSGNTYTAYTSPNGSSWTTLSSHSFTVDSAAYIGFAVTSHNDGTLSTATFDNITVTP